jgi:hypothetical protein
MCTLYSLSCPHSRQSYCSVCPDLCKWDRNVVWLHKIVHVRGTQICQNCRNHVKTLGVRWVKWTFHAEGTQIVCYRGQNLVSRYLYSPGLDHYSDRWPRRMIKRLCPVQTWIFTDFILLSVLDETQPNSQAKFHIRQSELCCRSLGSQWHLFPY